MAVPKRKTSISKKRMNDNFIGSHQIKKQIKEVEKFSLESPLPEINELFTEVYL